MSEQSDKPLGEQGTPGAGESPAPAPDDLEIGMLFSPVWFQACAGVDGYEYSLEQVRQTVREHKESFKYAIKEFAQRWMRDRLLADHEGKE